MSISYAKEHYSKAQIDKVLDPLVRDWFYSKFPEYTPPQKFAIVDIHKRKNVLISSPTGSGKTLSAFLAIINELIVLARHNLLEDRTYALYISPLKALNNDIKISLENPLKEIYEMADKKGVKLQQIRVEKRTGDTTTSERARQLRKPGHIFITTPESLAIILVAPKMSEVLKKVHYIITDEAHALADNKRGVHLSLSVERLVNNIPADKQPTRIGLSATIAPLEEIAKFLVGKDGDCSIVDVDMLKKTDIKVLSPVEDLIYTSVEETHNNLYHTLHQLIDSHKTTLIFTNTRSATERVVHHLKQDYPKYEGLIETHHGSLSKDIRTDVETKLKEGKLKCVVSSTSLELGIDIGYVDLVVLLGSPKSVARSLQRIGRSGHKLHETSIGRLVVLDRDDLIECTILANNARHRKLEETRIIHNALDVLAQHLIGMSIERQWNIREAYEVVKKSYCYNDLKYEDFISVMNYLSGKDELEDRNVYAKLWYDEDKQIFGKKGKAIRLIYYLNLGTIPDETMAHIFTTSDKYVGSVEESFLEKLKRGDRFVLGGNVYEFQYARGLTGRVVSASGKRPTIPAWFSEQLPLAYDLALDIGRFRAEMQDLMKNAEKDDIIDILENKYQIDRKAATAIYNYFYEQHKFLAIPTHTEIMIENYTDEFNKQNIVFHTLLGRRTNDALSKSYGYAASVIKKCNVGILVSDNGFVIVLPEGKYIEPRLLTAQITEQNLDSILDAALEKSEMLKRRFRHVASRAFLVLRQYKGHKKTVGRQKMTSFVLYHVLKTEHGREHPIIKETFREMKEDAMDVKHAKEFLRKIKQNIVHFKISDKSHLPSPFAHNMILLGHTDVLMTQSKKDMLKLFHQQVLKEIKHREYNRAPKTWLGLDRDIERTIDVDEE